MRQLIAWNILLFLLLPVQSIFAQQSAIWEIPLAGNCFLSENLQGSDDRIGKKGIQQWQNTDTRFSLFFRVDKPCELHLSLGLIVPEGKSVLEISSGENRFVVKTSGSALHREDIGKLDIRKAGYVRIDLKGISKTGSHFAEIQQLVISSQTPDLSLNYVKDNEDNRFYWGRRGPSVHLSYPLPADKKIEWFYNEITVPESDDAIGSYFMANGFGEGYFGIQVNSSTERRVLFSVWSPFRTDDPDKIPESEKIVLLKKGKEVRTGEFGNEGSGGQSYLIYPWKAGNTYRFLNSAKPDGKGSTIYSAWFYAPEIDKWQLIASFRRPKTDTYLTRTHSFLENFIDENGYLGRKAFYGNQWVRDTEGVWHRLTQARFTGDDIARRGYRLDFAGGASGDRFYLQNGEFFDSAVKLNSNFERATNGQPAPEINFEELESK